ncbi:hypothetical protein ACQI4E_32645 [Streptomyces sp. CA-252508]|uniref:hypothetical protein n=1 Tax=Streptomyces sp. CA-252508 TaxID=3418946 RepID=UPI003D8ABD66
MPENTVTVPLAPMEPDDVAAAFAYIPAIHTDDTDTAREFAGAEPRMPELLVDVAERIVIPVTALPGPEAGEPCADTFALEALGRVFVTSLRIWAQAGPNTAEGIARAVIDFAQQFLTDDHEDVADTLRQLEAIGVGQALDAHPTPTVRNRCACPSRSARRAVVVRTTTARRAHHRTALSVAVRAIGAAHRTRRATGDGAPLSHTPLTATWSPAETGDVKGKRRGSRAG